jgi:hypothetical protein
MKNVDAMEAGAPGKGVVTYYEDLLADPYQEVLRLAGFIGMTLTRRMVEEAVNASSFGTMRAQEEQGKLRFIQHPHSAETLRKAALDENKDPNALFGVMTRRGVAGGWRDEMDSATQKWVEDDMSSNLDQRLRIKFLGKDQR